MLRKDARKLKAVLRIIYTNLSFFKLKGDNIIMKRKIYSLKKEVIPLMTFITTTVPNVMAAVDKTAASAFALEANKLSSKNDLSGLCIAMYTHFTTFVQRNQFKGGKYEFSGSQPSIRRTYEKARDWIKERYTRSVIKKSVESLPERLKSMEEILAEELNVTCQEVGRIITGNPKFDNQYRQIMRYTSIPTAYA